MSPILAAVLRSVVLPAVLAGLALVLTGRQPEPRRQGGQGLILGAGFVLGAYLLLFHLGLPPADVNESLSYAAAVLAIFTLVQPAAVGARYVARALFTAGALALVLYHIAPQLTAGVGLRNLAAFYCLSLGSWSITETSAARVGQPAVLASAFVTTLSLSAIAMISGSATLSQLAGVVAGLLGASFAVAAVMPKRVSIEAVTPFASVLIGTFATAMHFYLDVNPWHLIACFLPFAVLLIAKHLPIPKNPLIEAAFITALSAIPLGLFLNHLLDTAGPLY